MRPARREQGFNLIELMIGIAIFATLMMLAIPTFTVFLGNQRIKNAAETTIAGINIARAEAVRRNAPVRFQFVSDLTASCTLSSTAMSWVVSISDPTAACNSAPGGSVAPQIIQAKSAAEGTENINLAATGGSTLIFNGLGRVSGAGITQLVFSNPNIGTCEHQDSTSGTMRCMQITIGTSGSAKICDPKVTDATDPRVCN
jgi:type IV fimbrial biogenesis protein FimT